MINKRKFINKRRLTLISTSIDTSWSPSKQMTQCFRHCCVLCEKIKNKGYSNGDSVEAKCIHGILKYNHCSLELIKFYRKTHLVPASTPFSGCKMQGCITISSYKSQVKNNNILLKTLSITNGI